MNRRTYAIVLGTVVLAGCQKRAPAPPPPPAETESKADFGSEFQGVRLEMPDAKGRPLYKIETKEAQASSAAEKGTLTNTTVTLYDEGRPDMIVTAPQTTVDAHSKDIVMTGGVTAKAPSKRQTFHVDRLTWNADTRKYAGEGHVRYRRPPVEMTAARIAGKTPVETVELDGGVQLNVRPQ